MLVNDQYESTLDSNTHPTIPWRVAMSNIELPTPDPTSCLAEQRNDRGWDRGWSQGCTGEEYLASGEFRNVYVSRYYKGPEQR